MVATEILEDKIKQSGKKKEYLATQCGITRQSLASKIKNDSQFTADQITALCRELRITSLSEKERIFFAGGLKNSSTSDVGGGSA